MRYLKAQPKKKKFSTPVILLTNTAQQACSPPGGAYLSDSDSLFVSDMDYTGHTIFFSAVTVPSDLISNWAICSMH